MGDDKIIRRKTKETTMDDEEQCGAIKYYSPVKSCDADNGGGGGGGHSGTSNKKIKSNVDRVECLKVLRDIAKNWKQSEKTSQGMVDGHNKRLLAMFLNYKTLNVDYFMNVLLTMRNTLQPRRFLELLAEAYSMCESIIPSNVDWNVETASHHQQQHLQCHQQLSRESELHIFLLCIIKETCDSIYRIKIKESNLLRISEKCLVEHCLGVQDHLNSCMLQIFAETNDTLMFNGSDLCFKILQRIWRLIISQRDIPPEVLKESLSEYDSFKAVYQLMFSLRSNNNNNNDNSFGKSKYSRDIANSDITNKMLEVRTFKSATMDSLWRAMVRDYIFEQKRAGAYSEDEPVPFKGIDETVLESAHSREISTERHILKSLIERDSSAAAAGDTTELLESYCDTFNLLMLQTQIMDTEEVFRYCKPHMFNIMDEYSRNARHRWYNIINDDSLHKAMYLKELGDWKGAAFSSSEVTLDVYSNLTFILSVRKNVYQRGLGHQSAQEENSKFVNLCRHKASSSLINSFPVTPYNLNDLIYCALVYVTCSDDIRNRKVEVYVCQKDNHDHILQRIPKAMATGIVSTADAVMRSHSSRTQIIPTRVFREKKRTAMRNAARNAVTAAASTSATVTSSNNTSGNTKHVKLLQNVGSVVEYIFNQDKSCQKMARLQSLKTFYAESEWFMGKMPAAASTCHHGGSRQIPAKFVIFTDTLDGVLLFNASTDTVLRLLQRCRESTLAALKLLTEIMDSRSKASTEYDLFGSRLVRLKDGKVMYFAHMCDFSNIRRDKINVQPKNAYVALLQTLFMIDIQDASSLTAKTPIADSEASNFVEEDDPRNNEWPLSRTIDIRKPIMSPARYSQLCEEFDTRTPATIPIGHLNPYEKLIKITLDSHQTLLNVYVFLQKKKNLTAVIDGGIKRITLSDVSFLVPIHSRHETRFSRVMSCKNFYSKPMTSTYEYSWTEDMQLVHKYRIPNELARCKVDILTGKRLIAACVTTYYFCLRMMDIVENDAQSKSSSSSSQYCTEQLFNFVCDTFVEFIMMYGIKINDNVCELGRFHSFFDRILAYITSKTAVGVHFIHLYKHYAMDHFHSVYSKLLKDVFGAYCMHDDEMKRWNLMKMYTAIADSVEFTLACVIDI